jgi:hypothetical protein
MVPVFLVDVIAFLTASRFSKSFRPDAIPIFSKLGAPARRPAFSTYPNLTPVLIFQTNWTEKNTIRMLNSTLAILIEV